MPVLALIEFVAAANALLLATAVLLSPQLHRTRARNRFSGFLFCYGWLLTTFMLIDQGWLQPNRGLQIADDAVALLTGALFLDYILGALGRGPMPAWAYAPAPLYLLAVLIGGTTVLQNFQISQVVVVYFLYTVAATFVFFAAHQYRNKKPRHLVFMLAGTWVVHIAQFMRIAWPDVSWIFDLVPLVGTAFMIGLTLLIMSDSRALKEYVRTVSVDHNSLSVEMDVLDEFMRREKPFLDPKLTVESLAIALNISSRQLSEAINRGNDRNFYDYINLYRVQESQVLLSSVDEARTSIEAIGLLVGFRARSTFYEAFRRITGQTPGEYRRSQSL